MLDRSLLRQCTLALALGAGLSVPALEGPSQDPRGARPERREDRQERHEDRQERREDRQERREDKQERREDRQERREDQRERRERRQELPMDARPLPRSRPLPRPDPYGPPGGTTQSRPHPRSAAPSDPGSTNLSQGNPYAPHSRSRAQAQAWERSHGWRAEGAWGAHPTWRDHRARSWESEHRTWTHRGGYGGYFIPEAHFSLHFGPERWFRIRTRPAIHMGYPRFHYGNYWFLIVDPWPEFWSETWYADDDVYIDYSDGYYLHNRRHPGISIAISVSL